VSPIPRHRTAIRRTTLSRPLQLACAHALTPPETTVFDYGCGHGDDIAALRRQGIQAFGWDPVHSPEEPRRAADVVNLGYVVNVIESPAERAAVLRDAWRLAGRLLVVAARLESERKSLRAAAYADGCLTSLGTFQKFYEQEELRNWIDSILGERSVPAGLGVFYVFRDDEAREHFLSTRFRRPAAARPSRLVSQTLFEEHRDAFDGLMTFLEERGRLPAADESPVVAPLVDACGSLRRAYGVLRRVTGQEHWETVRQVRTEDLLVYLALSRFGKRPRFGQLPQDLQLDVKAFFGSYRRACDEADEALFSLGDEASRRSVCRAARVGKLTPAALYVHVSALPALPPRLRIYEGCARVLVGEVEDVEVVKLHHKDARVSYLSYPDFERDPHPALVSSLIVDLQARRERLWDYRDVKNPPILHRKEEFVAESHPTRQKFTRLTRQEERAGLYEQPERIGTREGWELVLAEKGRRLQGHRLVRI